jgi:hypothetical protein
MLRAVNGLFLHLFAMNGGCTFVYLSVKVSTPAALPVECGSGTVGTL